jgi:transcription elongation factor Elf1
MEVCAMDDEMSTVEEAMTVFENVCPRCGAESLTDITVECHPDQAEWWNVDFITVKTNDRMASQFRSLFRDEDWISSRITIYTCKCAACGASYYFEQNVTGDWM